MSKKGYIETNFEEIIKRLIKYIIEGLAVALAARYIPAYKIETEDILMISLTAASIFAILDMYSPSIAIAARQGAGFAIGSSTIGGLKSS